MTSRRARRGRATLLTSRRTGPGTAPLTNRRSDRERTTLPTSRRPGRTALLALVAAMAGAAAAHAQQPTAHARTELVMSSWLPPRHPIVANAFVPWIEQIEAVTEGRVTVRLLARPLGSPPSHYYLAVDGIADITYGLHSFTRDNRFPRSRFAQFSFIGDDAAAGSRAFWRVYAGRLDAQAEHEGVKLLGLFVHGPGILYNNVRRIERPGGSRGAEDPHPRRLHRRAHGRSSARRPCSWTAATSTRSSRAASSTASP